MKKTLGSMESKKLKVVMVTENMGIGGKERRILENIKGLKAHFNVEVKLIILKDDVKYKLASDLDLDIVLFKRKYKKDVTVFFKILRYFRNEKPDLVQAWGGMSAVYAIPSAKILGIRTINSLITNTVTPKLFSSLWFRVKFTFPFSDIVMSNTNYGLISYGVKGGKGRAIHNGYDYRRTELKSDDEEAQFIRLIKQPIVVGMVGVLSDRKDWDSFCNLAELCSKHYKNVDFVGIGDGIEKKRLDERASKISNLTFFGHADYVENLLSKIDVCILFTGIAHSEGISNSILEYMATGHPVIATLSPGNQEIVEDGVSGYLVEKNNVDKAFKGLSALIENHEFMDQMKTRGIQIVKEKFGFERMVDEMMDVYKELIE